MFEQVIGIIGLIGAGVGMIMFAIFMIVAAWKNSIGNVKYWMVGSMIFAVVGVATGMNSVVLFVIGSMIGTYTLHLMQLSWDNAGLNRVLQYSYMAFTPILVISMYACRWVYSKKDTISSAFNQKSNQPVEGSTNDDISPTGNVDFAEPVTESKI